MASFPTVDDYLRPKDPTNDKYGTHHEIYGIGGSRNVMTIADMHNIPVKKRRRQMIVSVYSDGGEPALYWLLSPDNSEVNLANNNNWAKILLGTSFASGIIYKGQFNANTGKTDGGTDIDDSPISPIGAQNGWFYVCNTSGTHNFGSGNQTFNVSDWVIYDGSSWRKLAQTSALQWNLISGIPNIIQDIADGTLVVASQSDIQDLQGQIDALDIPNVVSDINGAPGTSIANITALLNYFYSKTEIDNLINGLGGGGEAMIDYSSLSSGANIFSGKYYEYDNKIFKCVSDHQKGASFDYTRFQYLNQTDIKFHTFTVAAWQAGTTTPQFTIPSASPGELHVLSAVRFNGEDQNIDELTYQLITSSVENDTIEFTVSGGSEFTIGDQVHLKYYSDEAQASGRTIAYETKEDKSWTSLATTGDNQNTGYTPKFKPLGHIDVRHDATGFSLVIGYGDKTKGAYWSNDSGTTALDKPDDIIPGTSYLYYNESQNPLIGDLTTSSAFSSNYSYARLEGDFRIGGTIIKRTSDGMAYDDNAVPTIANILDNLILDGGDSTSS